MHFCEFRELYWGYGEGGRENLTLTLILGVILHICKISNNERNCKKKKLKVRIGIQADSQKLMAKLIILGENSRNCLLAKYNGKK